MLDNNEHVIVDLAYNKEKAVKEHNKVMKEMNEKFEKDMTNPEEIIERSASLEIFPLFKYVLVKPYKVNPYKQLDVTESGIVLNSLEAGKFDNPDNGEKNDEQEDWYTFAKVIQCPPDSVYVKEGDDVMYRISSAIPVPFLNLGMWVIAEPNIYVAINENLKERFNIK